jgi:hypothetical protein
MEATRQGWSAAYRPWTPDDTAFVREHAGAMLVADIASRLRRSHESVTARVQEILLVRQTRYGYAPSHLETLFGAPAAKVRRWIEKGPLGALRTYSPEVRVSESDLLRFISRSHREYDLARVHGEWFKALVFGDTDKGVLNGF